MLPFPTSTAECVVLTCREDSDWLVAHCPDIGPEVLATALRDALLPKLISGELRVKDAERFLKERGL